LVTVIWSQPVSHNHLVTAIWSQSFGHSHWPTGWDQMVVTEWLWPNDCDHLACDQMSVHRHFHRHTKYETDWSKSTTIIIRLTTGNQGDVCTWQATLALSQIALLLATAVDTDAVGGPSRGGLPRERLLSNILLEEQPLPHHAVFDSVRGRKLCGPLRRRGRPGPGYVDPIVKLDRNDVARWFKAVMSYQPQTLGD